MLIQDRTTRTLTISEVKKTLSRLVNEVFRSRTRFVVQKSGIPVAALVSIQDLEWLQERDRAREDNFKAIERFSLVFADVPVEEAEAEIARIVAEIREEGSAEVERRSA